MNRKYPSHVARPLSRGQHTSRSNLNWARIATLIGGGAIGLSVILFVFSLISAVLVEASNTLNRL